MDIKELNVNNQQHSNQNHPWEYARASVINDLLKRFPLNGSTQYVLDIGCGDAFFLNRFCQWHNQTIPVAVDTAFSESIIDSLKSRFADIHLQCYSNVDQVNLNGQKASVIFLMDVIEHIEDDVTFLSSLKNLDFVDENTLFVITVPAFNNLYCSHDKWLGHYRRYSQKSLLKSVGQAGLKNYRGGYFFTSLLLPRLLQKMFEKIKGAKDQEPQGIGGWNGGAFISSLYKNVLLMDYYFFKIFRAIGLKVPGLSTYAICKLK